MAAIDLVPRRRDLTMVAETVLTFAGWMAGSLVLSLLAWVLVPSFLFGWNPMVVTSDSMAPLVAKGDVVLVDPDFGQPAAGSVVAFDVGGGPVVHRVVAAHEDGSLTTRGDANPTNDSSRVAPTHQLGTGRILVPFIGMVRVIDWGWLVAVAGLAVSAYVVWRRRPWIAATIVVLAVATGTVGVASAAFASTTDNPTNSFVTVDAVAPIDMNASCGLIGLNNVDVNVSWSHSPTTQRTGYEVFYDAPTAGDNWVGVATTGPGVTGIIHSIVPPFLSIGSHRYLVRTLVGPWESEDSNVDGVTVAFALAWLCTG